MVRRTTHLALVVLAVLVATGPSALVLADADGATGTDSGVAAAVGPLDATDDLADENTTDESLTEENLTEEETVENGTVDDETTDATATETNETLTNTTGSDVPTDETITDETTTDETTINATEDATTDPGTLASDATNESQTATNVGDGTDTPDVTEIIDDAASEVPNANLESVSLDATASSSSRIDAEAVRDAPFEGGDADVTENPNEGPDSGVPVDSDPATGQERRTENETTAAVTGDDSGSGSDPATDDEMDGDAGSSNAGDSNAGGSDAGGGGAEGDDAGPNDAKSPAGGADSDGSPDRDSPANPPSGTEAVAGVGALAAVAVFPHLADGLTLTSDAGALSAASSTATRSHAMASLQMDLDKVWRTATAFRYSRYDDSDPLAHETRATLHETVERSPGAYLSEVCERADVAVSTARHHLDVLEDEGLVTTAKVRGKRRYFSGRGDDVELAAALEDEEAAAVLRALARLGDSHGGRLADELDRDPSTVSHHLSRLEDAGLVEREREGRAVINRLAPEVARVLGEGRDEGGEEIEADREADAEASAIAD